MDSFRGRIARAIPIIAVLKDRSDTVGYFTGLVVHKFGLQILGSPFVGWTTDCMGFNLMPGVPVCSALKALVHYAFHDLGCVHLELANSQVGREDAEKLGFQTSVYSKAWSISQWLCSLRLTASTTYCTTRQSIVFGIADLAFRWRYHDPAATFQLERE